MGKSDLTTSQVAERMGVSVHAVRFWIKRGLLPNAYELAAPRGSVWMIPEGDLKGFEPPKKTGRPPKNPAETTRTMNAAFKKSTEAERKPAQRRGRKAM